MSRGPLWLEQLRRSRIRAVPNGRRVVEVDGERVQVDALYSQPLPIVCTGCGNRKAGDPCACCGHSEPEGSSP